MPLIEATLAQKLLGSIEADRLVILAGAGLSMAPPSHVPGAADLAAAAAARFHEITLSDVPAGNEHDLALLAEFFLANNNLVSLFLNRLVEWRAGTAHRRLSSDALGRGAGRRPQDGTSDCVCDRGFSLGGSALPPANRELNSRGGKGGDAFHHR